jgi:hypothetical protein
MGKGNQQEGEQEPGNRLHGGISVSCGHTDSQLEEYTRPSAFEFHMAVCPGRPFASGDLASGREVMSSLGGGEEGEAGP